MFLSLIAFHLLFYVSDASCECCIAHESHAASVVATRKEIYSERNDKIALEGSIETASWVKNTCLILFKGFFLERQTFYFIAINIICLCGLSFVAQRHAAKLESLLLFVGKYSWGFRVSE